jgi:hypothetical protein
LVLVRAGLLKRGFFAALTKTAAAEKKDTSTGPTLPGIVPQAAPHIALPEPAAVDAYGDPPTTLETDHWGYRFHRYLSRGNKT